ncbi:hypothetical protein [Prevotella pallens]
MKKRQILSTLTAILLIIAAIVNIRCEAEKLEKQRKQAAFLQYIHENSKPYKKCLKQDSLKLLQGRNGALRLDSIGKVNKMNVKKPYMPK